MDEKPESSNKRKQKAKGAAFVLHLTDDEGERLQQAIAEGKLKKFGIIEVKKLEDTDPIEAKRADEPDPRCATKHAKKPARNRTRRESDDNTPAR
jgi:hypothetical protein